MYLYLSYQDQIKNQENTLSNVKNRSKSNLLQTRRHPQRPDPHLAVKAGAAHPPFLAAVIAVVSPLQLLLARNESHRHRTDGAAVPVDHGDARVATSVRLAPPGPNRVIRRPAHNQPAPRARDGEHRLAVPPKRPDRDHVARAVLPLPHHHAAIVAAGVEHLPPAPDGHGVHRRRVAGEGGRQVVNRLLALTLGGLVRRGPGRPDTNAPVGGAGVHRAVGGDGDRVDGIVVRRQGLQAAEGRDGPDLERLVPGDGEEEAAVRGRGDAGHGVGMLYPEPAVVASDGDVVGREREPAEAVGDRGERGGEADPGGRARRDPPQAQPPVLVARHGLATVDVRHALDRAGGRGVVARVGGGRRLEGAEVVEGDGRRPGDDEAAGDVHHRDGRCRRRRRGRREERGDVGEGGGIRRGGGERREGRGGGRLGDRGRGGGGGG
uniref:Uncharacterized protein n=1 Tax=Triticum urartu TaxID=4572 RepID=A0A8R7PGN6_TRIUA